MKAQTIPAEAHGREDRGTILVTGATGNVGSELVRLLAEAGEDARAMCRSSEKAEGLRRRGAETVLGDLGDPGSLEAAMEGCDRVFLLIPPTPDQVPHGEAAIDAAKRMGVRRVVKLSVADANLGAPVPWARWHAEIDLRLRGCGSDWTLLKPTAFMQNFLGQASTIARGKLFGAAGDGRASWVDARDVAAVAARVLTEGTHEGATHFLAGPEALSMADVAARLSDVLGRPVDYADVPADAYRQGLVRHAGLPEWLANGIVEQYATVVAGGHAVDVTGEVARLTGLPPRTFADFARDHGAAFTGGG